MNAMNAMRAWESAVVTGVVIPGRRQAPVAEALPREAKEECERFTIADLERMIPPELALRVAYLPLVVQEMANRYARQLLAGCRRLRVHAKVGRRIRELLKDYEWEAYGVLRRDVVARFNRNVDDFMEENGLDCYKLWLAINSELKRRYPALETEHAAIVTDAMMTAGLCEYYVSLCQWVSGVLLKYTGMQTGPVAMLPTLRLKAAVIEVIGEHDLERTDIVALGLKIVKDRIEGIDFHKVDYGES